MKLSQLMAAYGDDDIQFQNLDHCFISADMKGGKSKISFGTEQPLTFDGTSKLALIVWLDRKRVADIIKADETSATPTNTDAKP